jgi:hypothetical protein
MVMTRAAINQKLEVLTYVNLLWPAWDWLLLLEFHPHSGLTMY